jgi:hypothetical protein
VWPCRKRSGRCRTTTEPITRPSLTGSPTGTSCDRAYEEAERLAGELLHGAPDGEELIEAASETFANNLGIYGSYQDDGPYEEEAALRQRARVALDGALLGDVTERMYALGTLITESVVGSNNVALDSGEMPTFISWAAKDDSEARSVYYVLLTEAWRCAGDEGFADIADAIADLGHEHHFGWDSAAGGSNEKWSALRGRLAEARAPTSCGLDEAVRKHLVLGRVRDLVAGARVVCARAVAPSPAARLLARTAMAGRSYESLTALERAAVDQVATHYAARQVWRHVRPDPREPKPRPNRPQAPTVQRRMCATVGARPRERRERRHVARSTSSSDPGDGGGESEPPAGWVGRAGGSSQTRSRRGGAL